MRALARPVAIAIASLLSAGTATAAADVTIPIKNTAFKKPVVRISKGELVVWKDRQAHTKHTVHSKGDPSFASSSLLEQGDEYSVRFRSSGEYRYFCKVHPSSMTGRIIVE